MATLHVRNVPDELYGRLKQHAKTKNRSLNAQVITLLDRALQQDARRSQQQQLLAEIQSRRFVYSADVETEDSVNLLREDRTR